MAESKEKLAKFNQEVQDTILGFSFADITNMIVDSFTDPSIDNALDELSQNIDGAIGNIIKKTLARNMLTEEMNKLVSSCSNLWIKEIIITLLTLRLPLILKEE